MKTNWLIFIPLFSLLGALILSFVSVQRARNKGFVSNRLLIWIARGSAILPLVLAIIALLALSLHSRLVLPNLFHWISVDALRISWGLCLDPISSVALVVTTGLATVSVILHPALAHNDQKGFLPLTLIVWSLFFLTGSLMADSLLIFFVCWQCLDLCFIFFTRAHSLDGSPAPPAKTIFVGPLVSGALFLTALLLVSATFNARLSQEVVERNALDFFNLQFLKDQTPWFSSSAPLIAGLILTSALVKAVWFLRLVRYDFPLTQALRSALLFFSLSALIVLFYLATRLEFLLPLMNVKMADIAFCGRMIILCLVCLMFLPALILLITKPNRKYFSNLRTTYKTCIHYVWKTRPSAPLSNLGGSSSGAYSFEKSVLWFDQVLVEGLLMTLPQRAMRAFSCALLTVLPKKLRLSVLLLLAGLLAFLMAVVL